MLHFVQIGWTEAVWLAGSGDDDNDDGDDDDDDDNGDNDDVDDIDKSPLELRKSNALELDVSNNVFELSDVSFIDWFGDAAGVTGAELLIGIWHWRQSIDVFAATGVVGNDVDFNVGDCAESLVT